eukprot:TRINITY_DN780136_c0_g1_i1.p1 TRINITY_DN780136_c0_g1~~TRINITY_DN780136_c0_g1_i1.p1  ORF type:complete len:365 (-),score=85.79 TRINITY_DN780136_c0_g1_i1:199-1269(-)
MQDLKKIFGFRFPKTFVQFVEFCNIVSGAEELPCICECLSGIGLKLVGPFEMVAHGSGACEDWTQRYRFYYDSPEICTVLVDIENDIHWGYYRDYPDKTPKFVVSATTKGPGLMVAGDSLFVVLSDIIKRKMRGKSKSDELICLSKQLQVFARRNKINLTKKTEGNDRKKKSQGQSYQKIGVLCPLDDAGFGYRELFYSFAKIRKLLENEVVISVTHDDKRTKVMKTAQDQFDDVVNAVDIANDESDFGAGLEFGLDLFSFPGKAEVFHEQCLEYLEMAYGFLRRNAFIPILQKHIKSREGWKNKEMPEQVSLCVESKKSSETNDISIGEDSDEDITDLISEDSISEPSKKRSKHE